MRIFDSHAHIDDTCFEADFEEVLERARENEVEAVMVVGVNEKTSKKAIGLAEIHKNLFTSVGIHPHDAASCSSNTVKYLKELAQAPCVKAWGEIGLDFNRMFSPADAQEEWMEAQIDAADSLGLPLIFHERDSGGRFLDILKNWRHKDRQGVIHCFSGTRKEMFEYLDMGYHIGITGVLTIMKRGAFLREIVGHIPENRILVETDAPYLTPAPEKNKNRRNEPAFVRSVLLRLAQIRGDDPDHLAARIWENTCRLYNVNI